MLIFGLAKHIHMILPTSFPGGIAYPHSITPAALAQLDPETHTTAIRLHPIKGQHLSDLPHPIAWHSHGRYLPERPKFSLDPDFHTGAYYVQDASSQIIPYLLNQLDLPPKSNISVLDLCAAPGGKSTAIAEWLGGEGCLVANEVIKQRSVVLADNLIKSGYANTMVCQMDPTQIAQSGATFDIVVVDAPCSGEGMWRKDPQTITEWSPDHVRHCAARQSRILDDIWPSVAEGGYLVYATCTYNHSENIDQVARLCQRMDAESIDINVPEEFDMLRISRGEATGLQCLSGHTKGEGLFVSVLRKRGERSEQRSAKGQAGLSKSLRESLAGWVAEEALGWPVVETRAGLVYLLPPMLERYYSMLRASGRVVNSGLLVGKVQRGIVVPSHNLAQSLMVSRSVGRVDVSEEVALGLLRKEAPSIASERGWQLASYAGVGLCWIKQLGKRINNYLPTTHRIK